MDERIRKWLYDIFIVIEEIDAYFELKSKEFSIYKKDTMLKRAVERNLEIIGEAVNRIIKEDNSYIDKIESARSVVNLRNLIIHAYDSVSDESIWAIIIKHLPTLKKDVNKLIKD